MKNLPNPSKGRETEGEEEEKKRGARGAPLFNFFTNKI